MMKFDDGNSGEESHGSVLPAGPSGQEMINAVPGSSGGGLAAFSANGLEDWQARSYDPPAAEKLHAGGGKPQALRVGYAAGAYDLFHIGHLNILRQAKQRCDYLIAGVVSDEMLRENKGIEPFIPEDERLAIVQSIGFVDKAILEDWPDKLETWNALRFSVFFKGDDWRDTAKGRDLEERFGEVGVSVEYLPYTLHTSSSKLRGALDNLERIARSQ